MCGSAKPERAIEVFKQAFEPVEARVFEYLRGVVDTASDSA
jgi:S-adenosylmethionine/arginine decarboxylase-like enzyme